MPKRLGGRPEALTRIPPVTSDLVQLAGTTEKLSSWQDATDKTKVSSDQVRMPDGSTVTSHASRHDRGGADSLDWSLLSNYVQNSATAVAIGVSGSPATIVELSVGANYYNLLPLTIKATPSGLGTAESATIHIVAVLDDATTAEIATRTTAAGSTATEVFGPNDYDFTAIPSGRQVRTLRVTAESSATATTATMDATVSALQL